LTKEEVIQFWLESSDKDFSTMPHLYEAGDYMWSLFIDHLVMEKLLKAYYIRKIDDNYPMIHNLLSIAEKAGLELDEEQQNFFSTVTVTGFNIFTRYDDYKLSFYKKCTYEYSTSWIEKIKGHRFWIKNQLLK